MSPPIYKPGRGIKTCNNNVADFGFQFQRHAALAENSLIVGAIFCTQARSISISRTCKVALDKLNALGRELSNFDLLSLRIGGASATVNNNLPHRVVKKHGRSKTHQ